MMRYAVILLAIAVGISVGWLLAKYGRRKKAAEETLLVESKPLTVTLLPWAAGLFVLVAGLVLLADFSRSPKDSTYHPAISSDGRITPGGFDEK